MKNYNWNINEEKQKLIDRLLKKTPVKNSSLYKLNNPIFSWNKERVEIIVGESLMENPVYTLNKGELRLAITEDDILNDNLFREVFFAPYSKNLFHLPDEKNRLSIDIRKSMDEGYDNYNHFLGQVMIREEGGEVKKRKLLESYVNDLIGKTNDNPFLRSLKNSILNKLHNEEIYAESINNTSIDLGNNRRLRLNPPFFDYESSYYNKPKLENSPREILKLHSKLIMEELELAGKVSFAVYDVLASILRGEQITSKDKKVSFKESELVKIFRNREVSELCKLDSESQLNRSREIISNPPTSESLEEELKKHFDVDYIIIN